MSLERYVIDKHLIGTEKHLLVLGGEKLSWIDEPSESDWLLSEGDINHHSLNSLFKTNLLTVDISPPKNYHTMMASILSGSSWPPPWSLVMPKHIHKAFVTNVVKNVNEAIESVSSDYHDVFEKQNEIFNLLNCAKISLKKLNKYLKDDDSSNLRSFQPSEGEYYTRPIIYDRFGSRTGRLTVKSGPHILSLKRSYRDILTSRWGKNGRIVMMDFNALEIRVIYYDSFKESIFSDIYDEFNRSLFKGVFPRNVIKQAVISRLYGQSKFALSSTLGITGKKLDFFIDKIDTVFKPNIILNRIKPEFIKQGYITNKYGRKIHVDEPIDNILLNSYVQSTGADVALLGFIDLCNRLNLKKVKPLFLLVDAIILDCHVDEIENVKAIEHVNVLGYEQIWPLKFTYVDNELNDGVESE